MATELLPDGLWEDRALHRCLETKPEGGRPRLSNRACLLGILYFKSGQRLSLQNRPTNAIRNLKCFKNVLPYRLLLRQI